IATTDNDTHVALGRLAIDKLGVKGINAIEVNNFNFSNREAQARLGALRLAGFTFALNNPPVTMPQAFLKEFRVADFAAGPRGGPEVALKEFALTMEGNMAAPTASELKLVDFRLPGEFASPIREAGYSALTIGMSVLTAYDVQRHVVESKA